MKKIAKNKLSPLSPMCSSYILVLKTLKDLNWSFTLNDLCYLLNRNKHSLNTSIARLEKKNWIMIDRIKGNGFSRKLIRVTDNFPDIVSLKRLSTADKMSTEEYARTKERLREWIVLKRGNMNAIQ